MTTQRLVLKALSASAVLLAVLASVALALRVIDVSNPSSASEVGYYDTAGDAKGLALDDNLVYLADGDNGLVILRFTGSQPPQDVDMGLRANPDGYSFPNYSGQGSWART